MKPPRLLDQVPYERVGYVHPSAPIKADVDCSIACAAVYLLPQDVGVPGVSSRFLDHVHEDPPRRHLAEGWVGNNVIQVLLSGYFTRSTALLVVSSDELLHGLVGFDTEVAV